MLYDDYLFLSMNFFSVFHASHSHRYSTALVYNVNVSLYVVGPLTYGNISANLFFLGWCKWARQSNVEQLWLMFWIGNISGRFRKNKFVKNVHTIFRSLSEF